MIEILAKAIETVKECGENLFKDGKFETDIRPDFLKENTEIPGYKIEAAAHSACNFFQMPDIPLREGDSIGVYTLNPTVLNDDVFQYNIEQFKEMGLDTFEEQTKVWTHECGHRILQRIFPSGTWANELGADFFVGVRNEMLGISYGNLEKFLASTEACITHPEGSLRMQAINFGRQIVAQMKKEGIAPTWENCIERFMESPFANITNGSNEMSFSGFVNDKDWHIKQAEYYTEKGDFAAAKDHIQSAKMCTK
jgi:hypothetical protein